MHSRVYSIVTIKENENLKDILKEEITIASDDQLAEDLNEYGHNFFDYIAQRNEFEEDIDWLKGCYSELLSISKDNLPEDVVAVTITKEALKDFYIDKSLKIEDYIDEKGIHPEDEMWCFHMKELIEGEVGGFRFVNIRGDWYSFCSSVDSFLLETKRYLDYHKVNQITFYIVASYDYHC